MGRHTKLQPPVSVQSSAVTADQADELLQRSIGHLEKVLGCLEKALAMGAATPAIARESTAVARAMTQIASELRQREKHAKDIVARMDPAERDELVKHYLLQLPEERRSEFIKMLTDLNRPDGLLGI